MHLNYGGSWYPGMCECSLQALNELHTRMEAKGMRVDEETLKWFLRDRYFNVQEADQKLARCLRWRHEYQ